MVAVLATFPFAPETPSEIDFGSTYGLAATYVRSRSTNHASAGFIRMSNSDTIDIRNSGNSADIALGAGSSDAIPAYGGVDLVSISASQTLTNKTMTNPTINNGTVSVDDTNTAFSLGLVSTSSTNLTQNRNLIFNVQDSNRTISLAGNLTVSSAATLSGTNTGDISIGTATGLSLAGQVLSMTVADSTHAGALSTATQNIGGAKNFTTQLIGVGTSTNDNAASGYIGEYLESVTSSPASVGTSGQFFDMGSIPLTAGDWELNAIARYAANGATFASVDLYIGVGTATGNSGTGTIDGVNTAELKGAVPVTFLLASLSVSGYRVSIASPTTYYLKGIISSYSVATPTYLCRLSARRVR